MAVFIASDKASGMTGTTVNLTMGRGERFSMENQSIGVAPVVVL